PLNENTTNGPAVEEQPTHDSPRHTSTVHVTKSSTVHDTVPSIVHDTVPSIVHAIVPRQNTYQVTVYSPQTPTDEDDYKDDDISILKRRSTRNKVLPTRNIDGSIMKYKELFVAKGDVQPPRIDFDEVFVSVARVETISLLIDLAAGKGWKIHHLQALRTWNTKLDNTLKEMYDLFMIGTSLGCINKFKKRMASQFEMSDLGELTYYLGIKVSQGKDCVEIKQERYEMKILKESGMENCNANSYPMERDLKLSKAEDEPEVEATQY
ncbi:uncharacterized mitochondrial protein-like protein, partial [Tanacetum coccineum]